MPELTLHNGDCLEVMKAIPDKSVDLIICDLPYGCLAGVTRNEKQHALGQGQTYIKDGKETFGCAWDVKINLEEFWKQVRRIRRSDHSPTIHFCTTKFGYDLIKSNEAEFRYDLVWDKQRGVSFLSANKMPMRSHEMIYVFAKAGAYYERKDFDDPSKKAREENITDFKEKNIKSSTAFLPSSGKLITKMPEGKRCVLSVVKPPQYMNFVEHKQYGKAKSDSTYGVVNRKTPVTRPVGTITSTADKRCVLSVIEHSNNSKKGNHPTEKPEALYRFLIERYCPAAGTVLDPTFGSGNSVFTAFAMDRNAIGIEKYEKFFEKAEERLHALP